MKKFDIVEAPSHYFKKDMWCEEAIKAITYNLTGFEAVCVANIVKYLWRYKTKNGLQDVEKAKRYNEMLIKYLEQEGESHGNNPDSNSLSESCRYFS